MLMTSLLQVLDVEEMIQERLQKIERLKHSLELQKVRLTTSKMIEIISAVYVRIMTHIGVQSEFLPQGGAREPGSFLRPRECNGEEPQGSRGSN